MSLTEVSARFFLQLAVGLLASVLLIDRPRIGTGYVRLMALFAVLCVAPALFLSPGGDGTSSWTNAGTLTFAGVSLVLAAAAGALPDRLQGTLLWLGTLVGLATVVGFVHDQVPETSNATFLLFAAAGLLSALVLGLVTGAMILGHWYLVTPDLPVSYLGRVTRFSLGSIYLKILLLALTLGLFFDRFEGSFQGLGAVFGMSDVPAEGGFQTQLDLIYLLARIFIGLIGPAVLCHMTIQTVKLKATQPATGILYAATIMVLMGELFAFLGESSFEVVL